jgi:HEAT repeat protein
MRAEAAIRVMGTNATPALLRYLAGAEPRWRVRLRMRGLRPERWGLGGGTAGWRLSLGAAYAFGVLGADAEATVPQMRPLLRDVTRRFPAVIALAGIGPEGLSALAALAASTNEWDRHSVALGLGYARMPGGAVADLLLELSRDSDGRVRKTAMRTLGSLRLDPERAVPRLVEGLRSVDPGDRESAVLGLTLFGPAASNALPELVRVRDDPQPDALKLQAAAAVEAISGVRADDPP